jgi:predicted Zn-dependent protease
MKHRIAFAAVVASVLAALVFSEIRKAEAPVGPEPILNFIGDTERELARLPVKFVPLSDADEIKIGKNLTKGYAEIWLQSRDDARDRAIEAYLQAVGAKLAVQAQRKLPYTFHYIPSLDFVNAFALPGGPVFIGGGLMALMDTEDELASVLGHELEHIDHYHCAERIQIQAALQKVPLGELAALPVEVFVAGYSKDQELEADREGTKLAAAALYSPQGSIQMFKALQRFDPANEARPQTPPEELSQIALDALQGYFQSHPPNAERIGQIQQLIATGQLPRREKTKPLAVAYIFLTERAWRSLQSALSPHPPDLAYKEKTKWEAERSKQFNEAIQLATQSLSLYSDQPFATQVVAIGRLGLGDYEAAKAGYRELLPNYPTFADRIREYADSMARDALQAKMYAKAKNLAEASLELQTNQPDTLKILAESQIQLSDFTGAADSGARLARVDQHAAAEVSADAGGLAASELNARQYVKAVALASLSLQLKADQWQSVATLADGQFALADFLQASQAYRKLLEANLADIRIVQRYADALSATHPSTHEVASQLFTFHPADTAVATQVRIESAGLMLLSGDDGPARRLLFEAGDVRRNLLPPKFLGRLAWWYYRAGRYSESANVLLQTAAQRPGDLTLQAALGFDELEQHQLDDAIRRFSLAIDDDTWNSPLMGRSVARWQARQSNEALKDFDAATKIHPEWRDPRWVGALYSRGVAQSVAEMQARQGKPPG